MTISPLALAAKKVIDAAWLNGAAYDLSSQAAFALESTQMLQSPETAAELAALRTRVAELEAERHSTNEALDDAAKALRARQALRVEAEPQGCGRCGIPEPEHMQRWKPSADGSESGWHKWIAPTQEQVKARMLARRADRSGGAR